MRMLLVGLALSLCSACTLAAQAPPVLAVISTDNAGGWLLFTDRPDVDNTAHIYVLGTDATPRVTCCARVVGSATAPKGMAQFFSDALHSDRPTRQHVFRVTVPPGALSTDNQTAMAVWNVTGATVAGNGYFLQVPKSTDRYEADACFGSEGMNLYLHRGTRHAPPLSHYYVDFGYDIGEGNCSE